MRVAQTLLAGTITAALVTGACSGTEAKKSPDAAPAADAGRGGRGDGGGGRGRGGRGGGVVPVDVAQVAAKDMPLEVNFVGTAEAFTTVAVHAQVTGQLFKVHFKQGDDVEEGQVLFELDHRPFEAALQQARANLQRDSAQLANARNTAQRYVDLQQRGIATREQVDQTRTTVAALEATVAADEAAVENAKVQLQYTTITAPHSGRTGVIQMHEGNLVRANDATALVVLNQVTPINVLFSIPEALLPQFKTYMAKGTVRLTARPPDDTAPPAVGEITFVDNAVDQATGQIKLRGKFENTDRRLWPGQFLNISVRLTTDAAAIVLPTAAVQAGPDGSFVYVVKEDKTVEMRKIAVTRTAGEETVVGEGVKAGETVVTDGQIRLVPGSRVSIKGARDSNG